MDAAADDTRTHLLGLERPALEAFVASLGSKPFRARQLMQWMYKRVEGDFASMTDLARDFRAQLTEHAVISAPDRSAASTTTVPSASPEMMRFRGGKAPGCGSASGGASLTTAPWPMTSVARSACSGG